MVFLYSCTFLHLVLFSHMQLPRLLRMEFISANNLIKEAVCKFSLLQNVVSCLERVVVMVACQELQPSLVLQNKRLELPLQRTVWMLK